jgi:hypothetical protein
MVCRQQLVHIHAAAGGPASLRLICHQQPHGGEPGGITHAQRPAGRPDFIGLQSGCGWRIPYIITPVTTCSVHVDCSPRAIAANVCIAAYHMH